MKNQYLRFFSHNLGLFFRIVKLNNQSSILCETIGKCCKSFHILPYSFLFHVFIIADEMFEVDGIPRIADFLNLLLFEFFGSLNEISYLIRFISLQN